MDVLQPLGCQEQEPERSNELDEHHHAAGRQAGGAEEANLQHGFTGAQLVEDEPAEKHATRDQCRDGDGSAQPLSGPSIRPKTSPDSPRNESREPTGSMTRAGLREVGTPIRQVTATIAAAAP